MDAGFERFFPYIFPIFFVTMWVVATGMLCAMSGWYGLQRAFPDRQEQSRLTLRMRSGRMGLGVNMSGILILAACPSGPRIGISGSLVLFNARSSRNSPSFYEL